MVGHLPFDRTVDELRKKPLHEHEEALGALGVDAVGVARHRGPDVARDLGRIVDAHLHGRDKPSEGARGVRLGGARRGVGDTDAELLELAAQRDRKPRRANLEAE